MSNIPPLPYLYEQHPCYYPRRTARGVDATVGGTVNSVSISAAAGVTDLLGGRAVGGTWQEAKRRIPWLRRSPSAADGVLGW